MTRRRALLALVPLAIVLAAPLPAQADATDTLRTFLRETLSGKGSFTQTVTAADGLRKKVSSGSFEFQRPNRFRFAYAKPFEQLIVADGTKVWIYDPDLKQASSRRLDGALDSTPAAVLAGGGDVDKQFALSADGSRDGLEWVLALPRAKEGMVRELRIGLRGREPAAIEVVDSFGQRSLLQFAGFQTGVAIAAERFSFKPPPGVDVVEQ
jgi:outer membrane lipoprotein carrier protein